MIGHSTPAGRRRNLQAASRGRISFIPAGMQFSYTSPSGPFLYYVSLHSVSRQLRILDVKEGCSTPSRIPPAAAAGNCTDQRPSSFHAISSYGVSLSYCPHVLVLNLILLKPYWVKSNYRTRTVLNCLQRGNKRLKGHKVATLQEKQSTW